MFMKEIRLYILLLFLYLPTFAQTNIGINTGFTGNYLNTSASGSVLIIVHSDMGFKTGIPFQLKILPRLFAEIEPEILQKSYLVNRTGPFEGVYKKQTNTYLQLPLTAGGTYGERLKIFANAGLYTGYWLSGRVKGKIPDIFSADPEVNSQSENFKLASYDQRYSFSPERDRRIEFGWIIGAGVQYQLNSQYGLFIKAAYYQSLTDQQKQYMVNQISQYNRTITLSIGGRLAFGGK